MSNSEIQATDNSGTIRGNTVHSDSTLKANQNAGGIQYCHVVGDSFADFDNNSVSKSYANVYGNSSYTPNADSSQVKNTIANGSSFTTSGSSPFRESTITNGSDFTLTQNGLIRNLFVSNINFDFEAGPNISGGTLTNYHSDIRGNYNISKSVGSGFGTNQVELAPGDYTSLYETGDEIIVTGSTSNDGTYTVSAVDHDTVGNITTITINTNGFTSEPGAGTVTGQIADLSSNKHQGIVQITSDVDFTLAKIKGYDREAPLRIYPSDVLVITIENEPVLTIPNTITSTSNADVPLKGRASSDNYRSSDFIELLYTGTSYRETFSSILP